MSKINIYSGAMREVKQRKTVALVPDETGRILSNFSDIPFTVHVGTEMFQARSAESAIQSFYVSPSARERVAKMPAQEARDFVRKALSRDVKVEKQDQLEVVGEGAGSIDERRDKNLAKEHGEKVRTLLTKRLVRKVVWPDKLYVGGKTIGYGTPEHTALIKSLMKMRVLAIPALKDILIGTVGSDLVFEPAKPLPKEEFYPNPAVLLTEIRDELSL